MKENLQVKQVELKNIGAYQNNARMHDKKQVDQIARSIKAFGFNNPILIDENNTIIAGHARFEAAKTIGIESVPAIILKHLSEKEKKAYILADNKLAEKSKWNKELLKIEFENLIELDLDFDLGLTGFETPELDLILHSPEDSGKAENEKLDLFDMDARVSQGDLWQLGRHYLFCGDSLKPESFKTLMVDARADMVFTDPPYNVPVDGHVCNKGKIKHKEFAFASGEMTDKEFKEFLKVSLENITKYSVDGSLHYICMDWRHIEALLQVGSNIFDGFKNICVWNKQLGGMGSLYRSQHEFICVFKKGKKSHVNNIELGKHGRYRTNVWDYPGVHVSNHRKSDLRLHPTVKPVSMIADAILDASRPNGKILDCFAGSGSTLLAAERTGRTAYLIEYEPEYCNVILDRFEKETGQTVSKVSGHE